MATPTRSQPASTPKPYLSTPNKIMASPRPGTSSNSTRPLAYKSPAVKTPASIQGHTHHVSGSSQPSSTPLPAMAIHDDLLNLTSPAAALINSLGPTGLTPLGNSADGLGISSSLQGTRAAAGSLNPEVERLNRLQLVVETLKSRVAGTGITREGVERIAQLEGFTTLWDDDNLTIAGNTVDLEVNFDTADRDHVRDVSLKLNTSENDEPQLQEQGTEILKKNLKATTLVDGVAQWSNLDAFAANLRYLSQLDRIEGGAPCFDAVKDLYTSFQKIWNAEKERFKGRPSRYHLKRNAVGKPSMDRGPKLGLALDFWAAKQSLDTVSDTDADHDSDEPADDVDLYTARISCEPGAPSTVLTKQWVSDPPFVEDTQASSVSAERWKPDWRDPAQDGGNAAAAARNELDDSTLEKPTETLNVLDMHFSCTLFPAVYLPLNVAANLNVELPMVEMNQELAVTYQSALQDHWNTVTAAGGQNASAERWLRALPTNNEGTSLRQHSYALHSAQHAAPLWCYPLKHLNFIHPKQLAAALPALRQYALVWSILRSLVDYGVAEQKSNTVVMDATKPQPSKVKGQPLKRTNAKALGPKLDDLLQSNGTPSSEEVLPIDLTLDVISDMSKARLDTFIPLHGLKAKGRASPFISLSFDICPGGEIEIRDLRGVSGDADGSAKIRAKIVQILSATEDIGLLVEWLLEQIPA